MPILSPPAANAAGEPVEIDVESIAVAVASFTQAALLVLVRADGEALGAPGSSAGVAEGGAPKTIVASVKGAPGALLADVLLGASANPIG